MAARGAKLAKEVQSASLGVKLNGLPRMLKYMRARLHDVGSRGLSPRAPATVELSTADAMGKFTPGKRQMLKPSV